MADRYDDRYRNEEWRRERSHDRDRGFIDRAGDEVRSWFGDDEAERRRRMDEARYGRDWERYGREPERYGPESSRAYGRDGDRDYGRGDYGRDWDYGHRMGFDYGRVDYGRPGPPASWNDPAYGGSSYTRMGTYGRGTFTGRGPRGYQRSDDRVREDVCERLTQDPWIDASDVEVNVRGGEVTLSGSVRDRGDKRQAEDLAERVSGVREVHNNLRVAGWEGSPGREPTTTPTGPTTAGTTSRR